MNVTIVAVDKLREQYLRTGCDLYEKRLAPYFRLDVIETRKGSGPDAVAREGRDILARIEDADECWALDRSGDILSSLDLSRKISRVERSGKRRLVLAIGGPDTLHESVLGRANFRWSLSNLTFLHEMSRLIVFEQLYRAAKIARGETYHR
jgi:23S rRNA (pseudouridine1915-N3)-methyltransferase